MNINGQVKSLPLKIDLRKLNKNAKKNANKWRFFIKINWH
ncbi:hypothetical protein PALB_25690 [Pseudoalteromonas luteoviolacea B = ATCC 29581]|nr:hypothetical protein PALB_25690 [Pseudoalteromonas luteoviolacea B = ATCC 29581]